MKEVLNQLIEQYKEEMTETLAQLVQIPSVIDMESASDGAPFGAEIRRALDKIMELGKNMGFEVKNYDGYAASIECPGEGKEIGILSHIDVVPPGNGWKKEPFVPVIEDGKMFGRGTIDDKGPMLAALYAMKAVRESGLPVSHHVKHIIGCDEETGHRCIRYYLTKEKGPDMGFSPDGMFSVIHAEKGILRFGIKKEWKDMDTSGLTLRKIQGGSVVNAVPNIARVWLSDQEEPTEFCGVSAHAMQPWLGENALLPMIDFLRKQPFSDRSVTAFFENLYELFSDGWEGKNLGIACEDQLSGKLTMNLGIINMEDNVCQVKVDIRCPVHVDLQTIWKTIRLTCQRYGLETELFQMRDALYVPKDTELVQKLLGVYNEMMDAKEEPITIGGGTYCRDVENFVSFGPVFPGEPELAHEADEFIDLEKLVTTAKLYAQAIYELVK